MCPIVLFAPTLQDDEVVIVQGARPMIAMSGFGRTAKLQSYVDTERSEWKNRVVLFMDAIELDGYDRSQGVPDVLPGNIDRELRKAFAAFSARKTNGQGFSIVTTGFWGCRSFGGDRYIKTIIQWIAATLAGTPLRFVCNGQSQQQFAQELTHLTKIAIREGWTARMLLDALNTLTPEDPKARDAFRAIQRIWIDDYAIAKAEVNSWWLG